MNSRIYTIKYAMIHAFYFAALCAVNGFAAVFLLDRGYSNSRIGIIMALSNIIAAFIQPMVASAADRNRKLTLKNIICFFSVCMVAVSLILLFLTETAIVITVCMVINIVAITVLQPFINTISVELQSQGFDVNFGLCRAGGALSYAVIAALMGVLTEKYSVAVIPFLAVVFAIGLGIGVLSLGSVRKTEIQSVEKHEKEEVQAKSLSQFLMDNKRFVVFLVGVMLLFYTHMLLCNYLIQFVEHVGGNSSHMGVASFIAAVLEMPAMIFFSRLVKKISCRNLLRISCGFYAVKFVVFFLADSVPMLYIAQLFQVGAFALFTPASVYYVSHLFGKEDMAKGQSMVTTATTLGAVFASLIGGWVLDTYGVREALFTALIVALIGIIFMILGLEKTSD